VPLNDILIENRGGIGHVIPDLIGNPEGEDDWIPAFAGMIKGI